MTFNGQPRMSPFEREHRERVRATWTAYGLLLSAFVAGLCVGFVVAAWLY